MSRNKNSFQKKAKTRNERKSVVLKNEKKKYLPLIAVVCCIIPAAVGLWYFWTQTGNNPSIPSNHTPEAFVSQISYPQKTFQGGSAIHYEYTEGDTTIRYFIVKSSDGIIRAAFDACDVCWPAGKGYYQEGEDMVCRNCSRKFPANSINEVKGGCNPAPLARSVSGENVLIRVNDILEGKKYFDFSGKV